MTYSAVRWRAWHVSNFWLLVLSPASFRDFSAFLDLDARRLTVSLGLKMSRVQSNHRPLREEFSGLSVRYCRTESTRRYFSWWPLLRVCPELCRQESGESR
ncbi:hypothetical protein BDR22DRAFT_264879 [Usnea florida]